MDDAIIRDYISQELIQDPALLPIENSTPLIDHGILDSLSLLRLVVFIQERFGLVVDDIELIPEHLESVNAICAYIASRAHSSVTTAPGDRV